MMVARPVRVGGEVEQQETQKEEKTKGREGGGGSRRPKKYDSLAAAGISRVHVCLNKDTVSEYRYARSHKEQTVAPLR